jgi:hypothetical protein
MTRIIPILIASLALGAATAQAGGDDAARRGDVAVVLAGHDDLAAAVAGVPVRAPRTLAEQLAVTHLLAARGVRTVVVVGVDRRVAVDPVVRRYRGTRFESVPADARAIVRAVSRAGG